MARRLGQPLIGNTEFRDQREASACHVRQPQYPKTAHFQ